MATADVAGPRERYVVLGLGRARAEWFRNVAQWATAAAIPAEFLKCVSAAELRTRLAGGRPFSATLLDGSLPAVDRDLIAAAREQGCTVLVVDGEVGGRDWLELGAAAVLPPNFGRDVLIDVLATHATLVGPASARDGVDAGFAVPDDRARVIAVTGPGGTGASVVTVGLAQGLAGAGADVLVADLCRNAEQAVLHDARDLVPGVQELVDAHRTRAPDRATVRDLTFDVGVRGYRLLLGLRRARYWSTLRPRAFDAAFASLRRGFDVIVADVDGDVEGEAEGGSLDVEERNLLARAVVAQADLVVVVGRPGLKGTYSLTRLVGDLAAFGVPADRMMTVVTPAPRQPRARAEIAAAIGELARPVGGDRLASPVFLPRRRVDDALRDGAPIPEPLPRLLAAAAGAVMGRAGPVEARADEPVAVVPGSLGGAPDG